MTAAAAVSKGTQVWLITGGASGFGRALAEAALSRGDRCIVTVRDPARLGEWRARWPDRAVVLPLDLAVPAGAADCVRQALAAWGRIDVLVNVAGESMHGPMEAGDEASVRRLFDVNFFGAAAMMQAVLPTMRAQRSGTLVNFSSVAAVTPFPGAGHYAASKAALAGLTEALAAEIEPLGLQAMVVEPGGFRTDPRRFDAWIRPCHDDYQPTVGAVAAMLQSGAGHEPGDPVRAARLLVDLVHGGRLPRRLPLGSDAVALVQARLNDWQAEAQAWADTGRQADFPPG